MAAQRTMPARHSAQTIHPAQTIGLTSAIAGILLLTAGLTPARSETPSEAPKISEAPITDYDREHWAFQPVRRPVVPEVEHETWPRNPIDRFILRQIEQNDLEPMPEADRLTLLRRVSFDLTGLPPTPQEIEAFRRDESPAAYEKVVDRLLSSTSYGERWAQHWLDLARFAETDGFEFDHVRPNAWRYRDWVIEALNNDTPYDEFVRQQVAGDLLHPDDPSAAVATGFLLCGPDMPDINLQEERRHNVLTEMAGTVGSVFLALNVGCAQCHNHKFDPVSQLDFYRFRAFFENADLFKEKPIATPGQRARRDRIERQRVRKMQQLTKQIEDLRTLAADRAAQAADSAEAEGRTSDENGLLARLTDGEREKYDSLEAELKRVKEQPPPELPMGRVMKERRGGPDPSYLRIRGDFRRQGPEVEPAFLRVLTESPRRGIDPDEPGQRAKLAEWLADEENPLTARVIANRLWQHHFGRGLSDTPSNFGIIGSAPTHPELLDWLASQLMRSGWSLKHLHRLMVTSATYRQASRPSNPAWSEEKRKQAAAAWKRAVEEDDRNDLLARMHRRRLEGEAIRDALLAASGRLIRRRGGPGIRPPLPTELVNALRKNQWNVSPDSRDHRRRGIYIFVRRNLTYPLFDVFDKPDTNATCPRRSRSTTALQSLTLLNSKQSLSASQALAAHVLAEAGEDRDRQIELCFLRALSRYPTEQERRWGRDFLAEAADRQFSRNDDVGGQPRPISQTLPDEPDEVDPSQAALTTLCLALFNANEFVYID